MTKINLTILVLFSFSQLKSQISFTEKYFEYSIGYILETIHGDFNGDGVADIVLTAPNQKKLMVGKNNNLAKPTFVTIESVLDIRNIAVHDIDQDGDDDILGAAIFNDEAYCWKNNGTGTFTKVLLPITDYESVAFADMTGDSTQEMLMGIDDKLNIYDITGGVITLIKTVSNNAFLGAPNAIAPVDYNNDGIMDISGAFFADGVIVYEQTSNLNFTKKNITPVIFGNTSLAAADLNADNTIDFMLFSDSYSISNLLLSQAGSTYEQVTLPETNGDNLFSAFGDINDDQIPDILYSADQTSTEGKVSLYLSGGAGLTEQAVDDNYATLGGGGFADLDGDGDIDIYLYANEFFDEGLVYYINDSPVDHDNDGFASDVDCNDDNASVNPGQTEIPYNGVDDDCAALTHDDDLDEDGFVLANDCNDTIPEIYPGATEIANNGIDEDCDGADLTSGLGVIAGQQIQTYPNPAADRIFLVLPGALQCQVKLLDITGKLRFQGLNSAVIPTEGMQNGTYLLEIKDLNSGQSITEKIILLK